MPSQVEDHEIQLALASAKIISKQFAIGSPNCDYDELFSVANLAIAEACERFDRKKSRFESWAQLIIRRRIQDHLRSVDFLPRMVRISLKKEWSEDELMFDYAPNLPAVFSLNTMVRRTDGKDGSVEYADSLIKKGADVPHVVDSLLNPMSVRQALKVLDERELHIVKMYFWDEITMKEIGRSLCPPVIESRISQLIARALRKMRRCIVGEKNEGGVLNNKRRNPGPTSSRRTDRLRNLGRSVQG